MASPGCERMEEPSQPLRDSPQPEPAFAEAQKWIEQTTGKNFGDKDFRSGLENGVLLCEIGRNRAGQVPAKWTVDTWHNYLFDFVQSDIIEKLRQKTTWEDKAEEIKSGWKTYLEWYNNGRKTGHSVEDSDFVPVAGNKGPLDKGKREGGGI